MVKLINHSLPVATSAHSQSAFYPYPKSNAWCCWPCARMAWCRAENVIDHASYGMYNLSSVPGSGLNVWSGLYDILGGISSSYNGQYGWFLKWRFFCDINRNQSVWLHRSDPKHYYRMHPSVKLWLIIANRPNAKLHSLFYLMLQKLLYAV